MMPCAHLHSVSIAQVNLEQLKVDVDDGRNRPRRNSFRSREEDMSDHRWNCVSCGAGSEPWMCLSCGLIHCSRNENRDALRHYELYRNHCIAMNCNDTSVFCYACDDFIGEDTEDGKIDAVRKSLRLYNKARSADHLYSSILYDTLICDDDISVCSDSPLDEGTEEEEDINVIRKSFSPPIFVVDEDSGSVPEDEAIAALPVPIMPRTPAARQIMRSAPVHVSSSEPTLRDLSHSVVKGGHVLRARKRKISPDSTPSTPRSTCSELRFPQDVNKRRGLCNLGNTCFINSVVQALMSVDWFNEFMCTLPLLETDSIEPASESRTKRPFYNTRRSSAHLLEADSAKHTQPSLFAEVLRCTLKDLIAPGTHALSADSFLQEVWLLNPRFRGFQQQDAHEFLRMMLDKLHIDLRKCRIPEEEERRFSRACGNDGGLGAAESAISRLFEGALLSQVICLTCHCASNIQDPFLDLSLEMLVPANRASAVPLSDCIRQFFEKEELDHCEQYMCARCGERRPSTKQLFLKSLPNVLCLHLKRFRWATHRGKLDFMVDFPLTGLDMSEYLAPSSMQNPTDRSTLFDLCSIIVHQGSGVSSGHYTAYGLNGGSWYHFNDERVKATTESVVAKQKAYILFYTRRRN